MNNICVFLKRVVSSFLLLPSFWTSCSWFGLLGMVLLFLVFTFSQYVDIHKPNKSISIYKNENKKTGNRIMLFNGHISLWVVVLAVAEREHFVRRDGRGGQKFGKDGKWKQQSEWSLQMIGSESMYFSLSLVNEDTYWPKNMGKVEAKAFCWRGWHYSIFYEFK